MTWVKRGLIKVWEGPMIDNGPEQVVPVRPEAERTPSPRTGFCIDCRADIERRSVRCAACYATHLESSRRPVAQSPQWAIDDVIDRLSRNLRYRPPLGVTCEDCGCLCIPNERCPACLVWAELDAARTTWNLPARRAA